MKIEKTNNDKQTGPPADELKKEAKEFYELASAYRRERFSSDIKEVSNSLSHFFILRLTSLIADG